MLQTATKLEHRCLGRAGSKRCGFVVVAGSLRAMRMMRRSMANTNAALPDEGAKDRARTHDSHRGTGASHVAGVRTRFLVERAQRWTVGADLNRRLQSRGARPGAVRSRAHASGSRGTVVAVHGVPAGVSVGERPCGSQRDYQANRHCRPLALMSRERLLRRMRPPSPAARLGCRSSSASVGTTFQMDRAMCSEASVVACTFCRICRGSDEQTQVEQEPVRAAAA